MTGLLIKPPGFISEQVMDEDTIVASDLPHSVALLSELTNKIKVVTVLVTKLKEKVESGEMGMSKGLSLLDLKNQAFIEYLSNLTYTTLRKLSGQSLKGDPSIERLVEMRILLERLRPLEDKIKYQIDKYIKVATVGAVNKDDPINLKGDIANIGSSSDEDSDEDTSNKKSNSKDKKEVYKAPKISQTHYSDDKEDTSETNEKMRRRILKSSMLRDALFEHTEDPEIVYNTDVLKQGSIKKRKEIEDYEESNFLRMTISKKDRASMQQLTTLGTMGSEMLAFTNLDPLIDGYDGSNAPAKKSKTMKQMKSKSKGKKGKSKKGFKRKHK